MALIFNSGGFRTQAITQLHIFDESVSNQNGFNQSSNQSQVRRTKVYDIGIKYQSFRDAIDHELIIRAVTLFSS